MVLKVSFGTISFLELRPTLQPNKYISEYQKQNINGASPLQLVIMLYDGALSNIDKAKASMASKDYYNQNQHLQRAQKIILELITSLDLEKGGEIAMNLNQLYVFVNTQLIEGNLHSDPVKLDAGAKVMRELRTSWVEVERTLKSKASEPLSNDYAA